MASDPMQLFGLYLDMKRRKEQSAQAQQQMDMQKQQREQQLLANAINIAVKVKDPKIATGAFDAMHGGRAPTEQWNLVEQIAKREAKAAKEAEIQASLPKGKEQEDMARGVAGILAQPGDPLRNAVSALRSYPNYGSPDLNNRIAMRGGSIAANRAAVQENQVKLAERTSAIGEARQIRKEGRAAARKNGGAGGGETPKLPAAVESAWETFLDSGQSWEDWSSSVNKEVSASVKTNAMKHPDYIAMLRARKWKGVPFLRPGQAPPSGSTAPAPAPAPGRPVTLKNGIKIEPM